MPGVIDRNTGFTTRVTKAPALCPHCGEAITKAPAWMRLMSEMAPGRGAEEPVFGLAQLAGHVGESRQRTLQMVHEAVAAGALERLPAVAGYRRTHYGRQL